MDHQNIEAEGSVSIYVKPTLLNFTVKESNPIVSDDKEEEICCICLDNLSSSQIYLLCHHTFHDGCLMAWVNGRDTCPICRY